MAIKIRTPEEIAARVAKAEARKAASAQRHIDYMREHPSAPIEFAPATGRIDLSPLPSSAAAFRAKINRR